MSSPITLCQTDMLTMLNSITGIPLDTGTGKFKYVNIWDDQIDEMLTDKQPSYDFGMPAAFVEVDPGDCETLGMGVTSYPDAEVKLHLCCIVLDGGNDTMEQNLTIFKIRDLVKTAFQLYAPSWMSSLQCSIDRLDYKHGNTYKYIIAFKTNLIDTKGSIYDADADVIVHEPPTGLTLGLAYEGNTPVVVPTRPILGWMVCAISVLVAVTPDGSTQGLDNGDVIPLQYALNPDGTLTIPELQTAAGIAILTPFMVGNQSIDTVTYLLGTFDNSAGGGFNIGNQISFNASLPLYAPN